jgi:hypothetical protein
LTLAAGRVADADLADLLARRPDVEEHGPGELGVSESRLSIGFEGYEDDRDAKEPIA